MNSALICLCLCTVLGPSEQLHQGSCLAMCIPTCPSSGSHGFLPMFPAHNNIMAASLWLRASLGPSLVACLLSLQSHPLLHSRIPSLFLLLSCLFLIRFHLSLWREIFLSCTSMFFKGTLMKRSLCSCQIIYTQCYGIWERNRKAQEVGEPRFSFNH